MTRKGTLGLALFCGCAILLMASCKSIDVYGFSNHDTVYSVGNGPPAHAKAHGYRRKHACGHELKYDVVYGIYVVVGVDNCYYHDGHFYRLSGDQWQVSLRVDSGWTSAKFDSLPPGLRTKAKVKGNNRGYAKGKH